MVYSTVSASRNVTGFMKYVRDEKSHTEGKSRVLAYDTQNVMLHNAEKSMLTSLYRHGKTGNVHGTAVMVSFDKSELNPDRDEDVQKALRISKQTMLRMIKDNEFERLGHVTDVRQRLALAQEEALKYKIVCVAQNDGEGGNLHVHNYILNINPETGRSLNGSSRYHSFVKKTLSEEMRKENVLEYDLREKNRQRDVSSKWENQRREKNEYVWKDDLRERIRDVLRGSEIVSEDVFEHELLKVGVHAKKRGKGHSFAFTDEEGKERKARAGKLGTDFELEAIQNVFKANVQRQKELEKAKEEAERKKRVEAQLKRAQEQKRLEQEEQKRLEEEQRQRDQERKQRDEALKQAQTTQRPTPQTSQTAERRVQSTTSDDDREQFLTYLKTVKTVVFGKDGQRLGDPVRMTFEDRLKQVMSRSSNPVEVDDERLLFYAEKMPVRKAEYNPLQDKYVPKFDTTREKFETTMRKMFEQHDVKEREAGRKLRDFLNSYENNNTRTNERQNHGIEF